MSQEEYCCARLLLSSSKAYVPSALHALIHESFLIAINSTSSIFTIAISGGSLPSFLSTLPQSFTDAEIDPQWDKWHVILADERLVPSTNEYSNLLAIRVAFLDKIPIPPSQIYGIEESLLSSSTDVKLVAAEYQSRVLDPLVSGSVGRRTVLDCVLLGFGPDGHTCSLFPNHELLQEKNLLVAGIDDSPKPPLQRITLTFRVLNEMSRDVIFVGTGTGKGPILKSTFESVTNRGEETNEREWQEYVATLIDPPVNPCGMVRPKNGTLNWIVDADAVQDLSISNVCLSSML